MSDLTIPGVTNKYDTQKIIDGLLKLERVPLERMQSTVESYKDQKLVWQDLSKKLTQFRDSARTLYGFENPFNLKRAVSGDESVLTATAERDAIEEKKAIQVRQVAKSDRFLSNPLPKDFRVPAGTYAFSVGDDVVRLTYSGGKLTDFAQAVARKSGGLLKTQVIQNTTTTQVMMIEASKTGSVNRLAFLEDSTTLGLEIGFLSESRTGTVEIAIEPGTVQPWRSALDRSKTFVENGVLKVLSGGEGSIPLPAEATAEGMVLELELRVIRQYPEADQRSVPPSGPSIPDTGSVTLAGVAVEGARSQSNLPIWAAPPKPVVVDDPVVFFAGTGNDAAALPAVEDGSEFRKVQIPLSEYPGGLQALNFHNRNTHRDIEIRSVRLFNPADRGGFVPRNPVAEASDAIITMDGIEIRRPTNDINDLIPNVSLHLEGESEKNISLSIEPDREAVKESIISFVGNYNQLLTQINILTRTEDAVIQEIEYFTNEERETARKRLGMLQGDITLMQMKTRLQNLMAGTYRSGDGSTISMLSQIGISTDSRSPGTSSGVEASRLRGYLEINEKRLDEALKSDLPSIKRLFGYDADGDLIVESGVAYQLDTYLRPYVEIGGILAVKQSGLDTKISSANREIESYTVHLERYEADLKRKYGQMEGALSGLEQSSRAIDNFSNSNSSRR
jgi:flagellar hook-associated protein 2